MKRRNFLTKLALYSTAAVIFVLGLTAVATRRHPLTPSELVEYSQDKIVVLNPPTSSAGGGTGFEVVAPSGKVYTVTNKHVCALAEGGLMSAQTKYHERTVTLRVLEISKEHDLCILDGIPNVKGYRVSDFAPEAFDHLYTIGHPRLAPNTYADGLVRERTFIDLPADHISEEDCTGKYRLETQVSFFGMVKVCLESMDSVGTSAIIHPGSSGSPVFNDQNQVIGVMFASSNADHYGFYVPLEYLQHLLKSY